MKDYIITVMAQDRVGIVRDVSSALTLLDGNITHVSQTVMRGYFTLIISVEMPDSRTQLEIRQAVERNGGVGEFEVNVRPFTPPTVCETCRSSRFTLTMQGMDTKGIISLTTAYLAECGVNVDDFYAYLIDNRPLILAQVSIPEGVDVEEVQSGLEQVGEEFGLTVHLQHENIFRATNEIHPILDLQRKTL